jgi:hypothetical protein
MTGPSAARFVDLERYPILELASGRARELVAHCRSQLAAQGACELPGFVAAEASERMAKESDTLVGRGHFAETRATVYLDLPEAGLPAGHPRGRLAERSAVEAIAYDRIPPSHALRQLFEWDGLMQFVAAALGKPRLYRYADPLGALNVAAMRAGDALGWHFDQTDFVVSIALRDAAQGGDFEYTPLIRSPEDERYDDVAAVLDGDRTRVRTIPLTPGTLLLFEGRNSLHRVTAIGGDDVRLVALLAYDTKPDIVSTELLRRVRYGRNA